MKKFNLHLADGELDKEIKLIQLKNLPDLLDEIRKSIKDRNHVWVLCLHTECDIIQPEDVEILIGQNMEQIVLFTEIYFEVVNQKHPKPINVFLQKYNSFEDAYLVARDMRETNKLCYNY